MRSYMDEVPAGLFQRWVHSNEEDSGDILVYRPESYPFPPARGRDGLELTPDGRFIEWRVGRGDAPEGVEGRWQQAGQNRLAVSFASPMSTEASAARPYSLEVVEVGDDVLRVRRSEA